LLNDAIAQMLNPVVPVLHTVSRAPFGSGRIFTVGRFLVGKSLTFDAFYS